MSTDPSENRGRRNCCPSGRTLIALMVVIVVCGGAPLLVRQFEPSSACCGGSGNVAAAGQGREPVGLGQFDIAGLSIPKDRILRGGPPKDGIPALVDPKTMPTGRASFLQPADRVVGVTVAGESRAYPISLLNYHEAINDKLGDVPVAVIYCPLCDSVSVVDRRLGVRTYTFGISGLLYNSNVLLYDRTDHALWSQVGLEAVSGPNVGRSLRHLPWELTTFRAWKRDHPDSTVCTFNTGHQRNYRRNPYANYFSSGRLMFPVSPSDARMKPKTPVIGVKIGDSLRAYQVDRITDAPGGQFRDQVDGTPIVIGVDPSSQSIRIEQMPLEAKVVHTFWFAWAAFHPETKITQLPKPAASRQTGH